MIPWPFPKGKKIIKNNLYNQIYNTKLTKNSPFFFLLCLMMDSQVRFVKMYLEGWAAVLLTLQPILLWEKSWHPLALFGVISTFYLTLFYLDLNTMTVFAVLGFIFNFLDLTIPYIIKLVYGTNFWNGQMEKQFEDLCHRLVDNFKMLSIIINTFYNLRKNNPIIYYTCSCSILLVLVHLTSAVNNMFLFFILTVVISLWPGIKNKALNFFYQRRPKME